MTRTRLLLFLVTIALLALPAAASAGPARLQPPKSVQVHDVGLATGPDGLASILVPVRYPIEFSGRLGEVRVRLTDPDGYQVEVVYGMEMLDPASNTCFRVRPSWVFGLQASDFTGSPTRWTWT